MATPAIAHFGTTIIEAAPDADADQKQVPITGALSRTLEFLRILGFQPAMENMYPGVGRQYIWRRGNMGDIDYIEQDNFTSYGAMPRPATESPRAGDTVFRMTHGDAVGVFRTLDDAGLVEPADADQRAAFLDGSRSWLLFRGPNGQQYELGATQPTVAGNHTVYVWTPDDRLEQVADNYAAHFGLIPAEAEDFHGIGRVMRLTRAEPGLTIGLLHASVNGLAERWTDDIFKEAGYSHFRLGALDKPVTEAATRQAFPAGGDVSFVYFEDSYLELVQA